MHVGHAGAFVNVGYVLSSELGRGEDGGGNGDNILGRKPVDGPRKTWQRMVQKDMKVLEIEERLALV